MLFGRLVRWKNRSVRFYGEIANLLSAKSQALFSIDAAANFVVGALTALDGTAVPVDSIAVIAVTLVSPSFLSIWSRRLFCHHGIAIICAHENQSLGLLKAWSLHCPLR